MIQLREHMLQSVQSGWRNRSRDMQIEKFLRAATDQQAKVSSRKIVLVEMHSIAVQQIPTFFMASALRRSNKARLVPYRFDAKPRSSIAKIFLRLVPPQPKSPGIRQRYRALGCQRTLYPEAHVNRRHRRVAALLIAEQDISSRAAIEKLEFRGCHVGDLIYDDFLVRRGAASLEPGSEPLVKHIQTCFAICAALFEYFEKHDVVGVVGNHVYRQGLVARIGNHFSINNFETSLTRTAMISRQHPAHSEFRHARTIFGSLPLAAQDAAREWASKQLHLPSRPPDVTNYHLERTNDTDDGLVLRNQEKFTVIVAMHCLSDSPHVLGVGYFKDYSDWLHTTLALCEQNGLTAAVKPHPACPEDDALERIVRGYPTALLLPQGLSLENLVQQGAGAVVTYTGNIAFEGAMLGIPAICAHPNNRYQAYAFAHSPKSLEDYSSVFGELSNLSSSTAEASSNELLEFFYMSRRHFVDRLYFRNVAETLRAVFSSDDRESEIRTRFVEENSPESMLMILQQLEFFVSSGAQRIGQQTQE